MGRWRCSGSDRVHRCVGALSGASGVSASPALLPDQPRNDAGPVFRAPWEAQAFAMAVALHEQGLFTWSEWARVLALQIAEAQAAGDADLGDTYYHHWLAALEKIVAAKG